MAEGTKLADAYVQIIPSAKGIKGKITQELGGEADSAGKSAGLSIATAIKGAIAAAGIGAALKASISEGADLQQSLGGIETLFKDSADRMISYSKEAYKKAGLSANDYMEIATSFAASLIKSCGEDTDTAASMANQAIIDMSDNANKMGTSMESIQNAYQGFAKQNYTMLDNLKLGYGGTKTEMQRLLTDAEKLSGLEFDISSFADITEAIHIIQKEMGITGATADEAASTFSGSLASMKAAFSNLLGNLSLGEDIGPSLQALGETLSTFLTGNLVPMVINIVSGLGSALVSVDWLSLATSIITKLGEGMALASAEIFGGDGSVVTTIFSTITEKLPVLFEMISTAFDTLWTTCQEIWQSIGQPIFDLVNQVFQYLSDNWDTISTGIQEAFQLNWEVMETIWTKVGKPIFDTVVEVFQWVSDNWNTISAGIEEAFQILWDVVNTIWTEVGVPIFDAIENILGIVKDAFAERMPAIQEFVGSCFSDIKIFWENNLKPCLEAIGNFIENVLAPVFEAVFQGYIGPLIDTVFTTIKNLWNHTLKPVFTGITDFLTGIFTLNFKKAFEGLKSFCDGIINGIITGIETFINSCIGAINGLIGSINNLLGKAGDLIGIELSIPEYPTISIPRLAKGGILKKGQVGLLEGSGAEAVVPLENNARWIARVAEDMNAVTGNDDTLQDILEVLIELRDLLPEELADKISRMKFEINNREFGRLVRAVN